LRELRQGTFPLTPPETGDAPPAHGIDPAVLTAKAEAGQPAGHEPQLGMRLPPPDWLPDSYGYRLHKQFNYFTLCASAAQARIRPGESNVLADPAARAGPGVAGRQRPRRRHPA